MTIDNPQPGSEEDTNLPDFSKKLRAERAERLNPKLPDISPPPIEPVEVAPTDFNGDPTDIRDGETVEDYRKRLHQMDLESNQSGKPAESAIPENWLDGPWSNESPAPEAELPITVESDPPEKITITLWPLTEDIKAALREEGVLSLPEDEVLDPDFLRKEYGWTDIGIKYFQLKYVPHIITAAEDNEPGPTGLPGFPQEEISEISPFFPQESGSEVKPHFSPFSDIEIPELQEVVEQPEDLRHLVLGKIEQLDWSKLDKFGFKILINTTDFLVKGEEKIKGIFKPHNLTEAERAKRRKVSMIVGGSTLIAACGVGTIVYLWETFKDADAEAKELILGKGLIDFYKDTVRFPAKLVNGKLQFTADKKSFVPIKGQIVKKTGVIHLLFTETPEEAAVAITEGQQLGVALINFHNKGPYADLTGGQLKFTYNGREYLPGRGQIIDGKKVDLPFVPVKPLTTR
jgi:hypothetical protein